MKYEEDVFLIFFAKKLLFNNYSIFSLILVKKGKRKVLIRKNKRVKIRRKIIIRKCRNIQNIEFH